MGFEWLKFGHVITIIAAIALAEGPILPTLLVARRGDVVGLRKMIAAGKAGERAANPIVLVSIAFGVGAALAGSIDLTTSWLLATYAVLAAAIVLGVAVGPHFKRLEEAAEASPDEAPSDELRALIAHPLTKVSSIVPSVLMGTIVLLMVVKPTLF